MFVVRGSLNENYVFNLTSTGNVQRTLTSNNLFHSDKTITDADDGFDAVAAVAEFLPQAANVNVERARIAEITVAPNVVEQILARRDASGAF